MLFQVAIPIIIDQPNYKALHHFICRVLTVSTSNVPQTPGYSLRLYVSTTGPLDERAVPEQDQCLY